MNDASLNSFQINAKFQEEHIVHIYIKARQSFHYPAENLEVSKWGKNDILMNATAPKIPSDGNSRKLVLEKGKWGIVLQI